MTDRRRPLHIGVFLGVSAGAYALGLAAVTALQARSEAATVADRAPTEQAIASLATRNDSLEAAALGAVETYEQATGSYDRLGQVMADMEAQLGDLALIVEAVEGAARALPARVALPPVSRTVTRARPVTVHATTAASGG